MIEILICEDNFQYLSQIAGYLEEIIKSDIFDAKIVCKTSKPEDIENYVYMTGTTMVFFLDIDLNAANTGYDLARKICMRKGNTYIVFISEHLEYLLQSFKVHAFDFLPKPVTKNTLEKCMLEIVRDNNLRNNNIHKDQLEIKSGSSIYFIDTEKIVFIEKYGNKSVINMTDGILNCYETLDSFEKRLDSSFFTRCHKSFIANKKYFKEVRLNSMEILFTTGHSCFIGKKYKERVFAHEN